MWLRFTLFDVRVVAHYLGVLVSFFTIALAVPLVVAIAMQESGRGTSVAAVKMKNIGGIEV